MRVLRALIPPPLLSFYHLVLAYFGALLYGFPSSKLVVIAVTGTKGKSTVVELIAALLRGEGKRVASASTIHFSVGDERERNLFKMTMPGRFFLQKFLRRAVSAGCTHVVIEMTSEGALQHRHKGISLNALVFTNLQKEHIERHGSMEAYANAKLSLARALARSRKRPRVIVANRDDAYGEQFLNIDAEIRAPFSLADARPYTSDDKSVRFVWRGQLFSVPLPGEFNLYNCLAALSLGEALGLNVQTMQQALEHIGVVAGRAEPINAGQPFAVVVDYAHTPDSLRALYQTYRHKKLLCVLGNTGGGRDTWKRPEMAKIADEYCAMSYLTNEDPYDENPKNIIDDMLPGFTRHKPRVVLERREAIAEALREAKLMPDNGGVAVLITGKGTDPYIMGARGHKTPWSDAQVAREELKKLGYN